MYRREVPERQIAAALAVNQSTVSRDLAHVNAEIIRATEADAKAGRDAQLRRLDESDRRLAALEAELRAAWERSKEDAIVTRQELGPQTTEGKPSVRSASVTRAGRLPLSQYMGELRLIEEQRRKNDEFRADLLGTRRPTKMAHTDAAGDDLPLLPGNVLVINVGGNGHPRG